MIDRSAGVAADPEADQPGSAAPPGTDPTSSRAGSGVAAALRVEVADFLEPEQVRAVLELVEVGAEADGTPPLNEAALLNLRHNHPGVTHLLARVDGTVMGYAQLHGEQSNRTGALVVHPRHRRQGAGRALLDSMINRGPVRLWAMGDTPGAQALARAAGLHPVRELLIMKRSLVEPVPARRPPEGVIIRTFVVGSDEQDWLAVNARAFGWHPEQSRMTLADLTERLAEPWFDPAGFFVAVRARPSGKSSPRAAGAPSRESDSFPGSLALERDRRRSEGSGGSAPRTATALIGFHWTKQHPGRLGEVYVLGVDPEAAGTGLGKALLAAGLEHLRERGNTEVELYTESDNQQALSLYFGYGFAVASRDVMYGSSEIDSGSGVEKRLAEG
jgi:mycothiol synthase